MNYKRYAKLGRLQALINASNWITLNGNKPIVADGPEDVNSADPKVAELARMNQDRQRETEQKQETIEELRERMARISLGFHA